MRRGQAGMGRSGILRHIIVAVCLILCKAAGKLSSAFHLGILREEGIGIHGVRQWRQWHGICGHGNFEAQAG